MGTRKQHYLEKELYDEFRSNPEIFTFFKSNTLDGVWYWDLEKPENEWLSPRFWKLLGYDPEDKKHLASEWQHLINQDDLKVAVENFEKHCADPNHPYDQIVRYIHKNGSTVWVRCRGVAVRDANGKPIRMLGAHTDVTQLKQTEIRLQKRTEELEAANKKLRETLQGILPICMYCHKIRDDGGDWQQMESYISANSDADFSHSICPGCIESGLPESYESHPRSGLERS